MTVIVASLQVILELQHKHDNFADSLSPTGFTWKIHKYLASMTKQNSDRRSSSSTSKTESDHSETPHQHGILVARDLKIFIYDELKCASRDFGKDTRLGKGNGTVYKGWVDKMTYLPCMHDTGSPIVIKRLSYNSYKHFDPDMLKEFYHPNLVELIGYCLEGEHLFLVYEFMPNGNLKDLLCSGAIAQLPLVVKVKIVVGVARVIVFLQTVGEYRLQRRKILLDEGFAAKLLDYDVMKMVHGHYPNKDLLSGHYYPGFKVLTGRQIFYENEVQKIDDFLLQRGKLSLSHIAKSCLEMCDDVDSESKLLTMLEEYDKFVPEITKETFTKSNESYLSLREVYTMKGHIDSVVELKGLNMDTDQLHYSV
ncbi:hypothetical protein QVD17_03227 [Tagetes erecta]|uniref:Protein kinase domain-containing protein n=1 Tax=Tagetes erecta TaxID=13708 RepID=A0AAD8LDY0_TARER|nr:hypothetical protein QVD17_03227 [Tagetes erecta]